MTRLLTRARARQPNPEIFAGLVTTCRYGGLLDESIAAHALARGLDPTIRTSVTYAHYLKGDYGQTIETDDSSPPFATALARMRLGEDADAIDFLRDLEESNPHPGVRIITAAYRLAMERDADGLVPKLAEMSDSGFGDPEGFFLLASFVARDGAAEGALATLERAVSGGFCCPSALRDDPYFDPIRGLPAFSRLMAQAEAGHARARDAFARVGGPGILHPSR
jgi:hypothetical protein